jgi:predicted outer membrane protein
MKKLRKLVTPLFAFSLVLTTGWFTPAQASSLLAQTEFNNTLLVLNRLNNESVATFLHHFYLSEITEAQQVLDRLSNQVARSFAQLMITDHQQDEKHLLEVAEQKNISLEIYQPSTVQKAAESSLKTLSGFDLDLAYLQNQMMGHQIGLQNLRIFQKQVTDPNLIAIVNSSIQATRNHYKMVLAVIYRVLADANSIPTGQPHLK